MVKLYSDEGSLSLISDTLEHAMNIGFLLADKYKGLSFEMIKVPELIAPFLGEPDENNLRIHR